MIVFRPILKCFVAAVLLAVPSAAVAQSTELVPDAEAVSDGTSVLDKLFERLQQPELPEWESVENAIWREWSASGSASVDLLLERGRESMSDGEYDVAVEHFTAVIDHAPGFAEGWNARATAYFGQQRYGLSIADIQKALALNPRHFGALQGLGRILEELEDYPNALKAFKAAYALHPHRPGLQEGIDRLEILVAGQTL